MKQPSEMPKADRLLHIYSKLVNGEYVNKSELATYFHVSEKSIQRDINSLRCFFTEQSIPQIVKYDGKTKGYFLERKINYTLTNSEIFVVCKILLESRSMVKEEIVPILDKLGGILLQLYKFMEQKIKTNFYNVNFLIISNFIPFKMCKK